MTVESMTKAFDIVYSKIGAYEYDRESSKRAGYRIYRSVDNYYDYACDLGNRVELNTRDGNTTNIWIEDESSKIEKLRQKVSEQEIEILKLKAKLYDILCK